LITAYALYTQQPILLFVVAFLGMWAFFFPAAHPMDLIYNYGVRHLFSAVKLPANPFQRRLACFAAGIMNTMAAGFFLAGMPLAAIITGGMLLVLQLIVISTHFCTLSWMYEGMMRVLGKWHVPVSLEEAKVLLEKGAAIIDVRSQNEYASKNLEGTKNLPLEEIHEHKDAISGPVLLFCNSGTRSHIAAEKLKEYGHQEIYNLGAFTRAESLLLANT
jgi:rhodanese-related sulfurtransferase